LPFAADWFDRLQLREFLTVATVLAPTIALYRLLIDGERETAGPFLNPAGLIRID
jgi:hypothetical protein